MAEIGVAHEGSLRRARRLVQLAADAGADAVKLQVYKADTLAHPHSPTYFDPAGDPAPTQHAFFRRYDGLNPDDYRVLATDCARLGVDFLCTPFDLATVEWLNDLVPAWKIASADLTNVPLLRAVRATGKPLLLSTGAATLQEITEAVLIIAGVPVALLHCVLAYPTPPEDANLLAIQTLGGCFPDAVLGYSDHTLATPDMTACTLAYALGAQIIEKHFTDDKTQRGNDHYHSMDADDLAVLRMRCTAVRTFLGSGVKAVQVVEELARQHARRGLYAAQPIQRGEFFTAANVAILRPAARLGPDAYADVLQQAASRDYAVGDAL